MRRVDVGHLAHSCSQSRYEPKENRRGHDHPRQYRAPNAEIREVHGPPLDASLPASAIRCRLGGAASEESPAGEDAAGADLSLPGPFGASVTTFTLVPSASASTPRVTSIVPASSPFCTSTKPSVVFM